MQQLDHLWVRLCSIHEPLDELHGFLCEFQCLLFPRKRVDVIIETQKTDILVAWYDYTFA